MGKKQGQALRMVSPDVCVTTYEQLLRRRQSTTIPSRRLSMRVQKGRLSIADSSSIVHGCDDNALHHHTDTVGLRNKNLLTGLYTHPLHNHHAIESATHTLGPLVESHNIQPHSVHDTDILTAPPPTMTMTIMLQIPPKLSVPNMTSISHLYPSTGSDTDDSGLTMIDDKDTVSSLFVASTDTPLDNDSDSTESDGSNDDDTHTAQDDSDSDDDVPLALRLIDQPIISVLAPNATSAHACTADQSPLRSSPPIRRRLPPSLHPFNMPVSTKHRSSSTTNMDISPQLFSSALNGKQAAEIMTSIRQRKREHRDKSGTLDNMDETFPSQSSAPTNMNQRHVVRRRRNRYTISPLTITAITNAAVTAMSISDISTESPSQSIINTRLRACIERKRKRTRRVSEGTSPSPKPPPRKPGMSLRDQSDTRVEPDTDTSAHQSQPQTSCDASDTCYSENGSTVTSDSDHVDPVSIGGVVISGTYRYSHSSVSVSILRACIPRIVMRTPTSPLSLSAIHQDHRTSNDSDQTLVNTPIINQPTPRTSTDVKRRSSSAHQSLRSSITKSHVPVSLQSSKCKSKWKPSFWSMSMLSFKSRFSGKSSSVLPPWSEVIQSALSVSSSVSDKPSLQHRPSQQLNNDVQHMPSRHVPPRAVRNKRSSSLNALKRLSLSVPVSSVSVMSTIVSPISPTESNLVVSPSTPVSAHGTDSELTYVPHGMATWLQPPVTPSTIHDALIEAKRRMDHDANHRSSIYNHRDTLDFGDTKHLKPVSTSPPLVPLSHTMNPIQHEKQHMGMLKSKAMSVTRERTSSLHKPWFMVDGSLSTPMPPLPPFAASRHHQTPTVSSDHTNTVHVDIKPFALVSNFQSPEPVKRVPVRATRSLSIISLRPMHKLDIYTTPHTSPKSMSLPSLFRRNTINSFTNGHITSHIKSVFSSPVSPSDSGQPCRSKTVLPHIHISTTDSTESLSTLNSSSSTLSPIDMQYLYIDNVSTDRPSSTETVCTIHNTETLTNADTENQWFVKPLPIVLMDNAGHVTDTKPSYLDLSDHHKLDTMYDLMTPSVYVSGLENGLMHVLDTALTSTNI